MRILAGIFKLPTNNENANKLYLKNVNVYKNSNWTSFCIIINNVRYKHVNASEMQLNNEYCIEICIYNNRPSLVWNNMIIYQHDKWFNYNVEFTLTDANNDTNKDINKDEMIYKYVVKELCSDEDMFRYLN